MLTDHHQSVRTKRSKVNRIWTKICLFHTRSIDPFTYWLLYCFVKSIFALSESVTRTKTNYFREKLSSLWIELLWFARCFERIRTFHEPNVLAVRTRVRFTKRMVSSSTGRDIVKHFLIVRVCSTTTTTTMTDGIRCNRKIRKRRRRRRRRRRK